MWVMFEAHGIGGNYVFTADSQKIEISFLGNKKRPYGTISAGNVSGGNVDELTPEVFQEALKEAAETGIVDLRPSNIKAIFQRLDRLSAEFA